MDRTAITSGNWNNASTWDGPVPTASDRAIIPAGITVTLTSGGVAQQVRLNGTLNCQDSNLTTGLFLQSATGFLRMRGAGTWTTTGIELSGAVDIAGAFKTPYLRCAVAPAAGDRSLTLTSAPANWSVGDTVFVPESRDLTQAEVDSGISHAETRTIQSITNNVVTLNSALAYDHLGILDDLHPFNVHAVNLTRSLVFQHGYLYLPGNAPSISYARFRDFGTDDRYPIDCECNSPNLTGIVVDNLGETYQWGVVLQGTTDVSLNNCIVLGSNGAGFVTTTGSETGTIDGCFAAEIFGNGLRITDSNAENGTGFWFRGPLLKVQNCIASGCKSGINSYGFNWFMDHLGNITLPNGSVVDGNNQPLGTVSGNEVYGCGSGFTFWWIGTHAAVPLANQPVSTLSNLACWNCYCYGLYFYEVQNVNVVGYVCNSNITPWDRHLGLLWGDYTCWNCTVTNPYIKNRLIGLQLPFNGSGAIISGGTIANNGTDFWWTAPNYSNGAMNIGPLLSRIQNVTASTISLEPRLSPAGQPGNFVVRNQLFVQGWQGANFQVYFAEQDPSWTGMPVTSNPGTQSAIIGYPQAGVSNQQGLAMGWSCFAGEMFNPATVVYRPGIDGPCSQ
jgi:hypothetical protein